MSSLFGQANGDDPKVPPARRMPRSNMKDRIARLRYVTLVFLSGCVALGLLQRCVSLGVAVPDDLAIVGYDDIVFASAAAVPLTSVRQPRREMGRQAAQLLVDEAANPDHEHRQILFTPELVARASTRGARRHE